jgi:hypothetical protein
MRISVPFTWREEYLLKGGAKPVAKVFGDLMMVDVPEYRAEDAPSVVSWTETNGDPRAMSNRIDIRMIGDHFYTQAADRMHPAASFAGHRLENAFGRDDYRRLFQGLLHSPTGNYQKHVAAFDNAIRPVLKVDVAPSAKSIEYVLTSDKETREGQFKSVAENLAIIDGSVWIKGSEPTVVIHDDVKPQDQVWNGTRATVACAINVFRPSYGSRFVSGNIGISIGLPDTTSIYSMLDWEEACAAHAAIVHPNRDRYTIKRCFEDVVIHDPSVFSFDPICSPVSRTVAYALDAFGKDMEAWSRGEANMFLDVRDLLAEFDETGDVLSLERSVVLLRGFMGRTHRLGANARAAVSKGLDQWPMDDAGIEVAFNQRKVGTRP